MKKMVCAALLLAGCGQPPGEIVRGMICQTPDGVFEARDILNGRVDVKTDTMMWEERGNVAKSQTLRRPYSCEVYARRVAPAPQTQRGEG